MTTQKEILQHMIADLAEMASTLGALKGDYYAYLNSPDYQTLFMRLEMAQAAVEGAMVEARRRARLNG